MQTPAIGRNFDVAAGYSGIVQFVTSNHNKLILFSISRNDVTSKLSMLCSVPCLLLSAPHDQNTNDLENDFALGH